MTVGIAWIRVTERGEELWLASDSRLSGNGRIWDDCPKLLVSPRRDMALGFSGSTSEAYPLVLQLTAAVAAFRPAVEEMAREGVPLNIIQRQLGHTDLGVTSIYPQGIDNAEIVNAVHACRAPMMPASAGLRL